MEDGLAEIMSLIQEMMDDGSVPRNVKKTLDEVKSTFESSDGEFKLKVDAAIQTVEELSLNPNLPSHARAHIWNMSSVLEDLSK